MHAPPKPDYPVITPNALTEYDAFLFGIPTRYGNFPAQWKARSHHSSSSSSL
jgi:NAD(P)H dehydrogenase (quinone)